MMEHFSEEVERLQESHSGIISRIESAISNTEWEPVSVVIVPTEEPYVDSPQLKVWTDYILRTRAVCEHGLACHDVPLKEEQLDGTVLPSCLVDQVINGYQKLREESDGQHNLE